MKDWHIPFMLFELSSYAKRAEKETQQDQPGKEPVTGMHNFFNDDNPEEAMNFFWDNLEMGDD